VNLPLSFAAKPNILDDTIAEALKQLSGIKVDDEVYSRRLDQIAKLYKLKEQEAPRRVSPDVIWTVLGNLTGIAMILGYEHARVVTSKAIGFVLKPR
jgi:hypothetical protein